MKRVFATIATAAFAIATPASAEWLHQVNDDPFQGKQQLAFGTDPSGFSVALRCTNAEDLTLVFISREKVDLSLVRLANRLGPHLGVVVDDQPKVELAAQMYPSPDGEHLKLEASSPDVAKVAAVAARANRRIALAGMLNGKIANSHSFDATGSATVIGATLEACGVKLPSESVGAGLGTSNPDVGD
jgi:hypothetical protein